LTRYRIYRNPAMETTYIAAHEENKLRNSAEFPNLDMALAALRQCGIPEYEIARVTKELDAINGAIVQLPEPIVFSRMEEDTERARPSHRDALNAQTAPR
jgi:hypothetical protein